MAFILSDGLLSQIFGAFALSLKGLLENLVLPGHRLKRGRGFSTRLLLFHTEQRGTGRIG